MDFKEIKKQIEDICKSNKNYRFSSFKYEAEYNENIIERYHAFIYFNAPTEFNGFVTGSSLEEMLDLLKIKIKYIK
jgi:hypothetical protein